MRDGADAIAGDAAQGAQIAMNRLHVASAAKACPQQTDSYMGIKCGIVGLPNVGKSTLFNALTRAQIAAENYPFCTIDPNVGVVPVPDPRLDAAAGDRRSREKILPTTVEFVDIAGLVAGASKGEGLGNQFLAHIRETDAIAHVVRCFEDADVVHVSGGVDPHRRHRHHRHRAGARGPADGREGRRPRRQGGQGRRQGRDPQARPVRAHARSI